MIEKILGVTRIQKINYYDPNQQPSRDSMRKKPELDFQNILNRKMKAAEVSSPYQVNLTRPPE